MPEPFSADHAGPGVVAPLRFVDSAHVEPKKKKAHKKSRVGCVACKTRKVKCDEKVPCGNCLRRNEPCAPSRKHTSPEREASPAPEKPLDSTGPVNLLHMELFHHFDHVTVPTLCFREVWATAITIAFKEEYLMTAMLAVSARHLAILRPQDPVYAQAAMALLSRSCAEFGAVIERDNEGENHNPLFFTAMLIHYLTWCNLEFLEDQRLSGTDNLLDLGGDQLFLLSSGVRVFLSGTRAQGSYSVFAKMTLVSQCHALETIVAEQGMDCDAIVQAFMDRFDELTPRSALSLGGDAGRTAQKREAYRGIVLHLSVILALLKYQDSNPSPPQRPDVERFIFSFPLFCVGTFLDMIVGGDSRALLVLYHFYRASRLLLGVEESWWASERLNTMESLIKQELERRNTTDLAPEVSAQIFLTELEIASEI